MDISTVNILAQIGNNLTALAVKGTATAVHSKIESVKNENNENNAETLRNTYDEIINQLLSEREESIRMAQAYKEELDKVVISDSDIEHLHKTVSMVLEIIKTMSPHNRSIDSIGQLKDLISVDVLKTMQLLGLNYKAAVGLHNAKLNIYKKAGRLPCFYLLYAALMKVYAKSFLL